MKKIFKISLITLGSSILLLILISMFITGNRDIAQRKIREAKEQADPEWIAYKEKAEIRESAHKYFGVSKANNSGLRSFQYVDRECTIDYRFYPVGLFKYETELGSSLATDIKLMYKKHYKIKNFVVRVASPFKDKYGKTTWKAVGSFEFSRGLYNRINWNDFNSGDLLKVAENVKGF